MNVTTVAISEEAAEQKLLEYKAIPAAKRSPQDEALMRAYRTAVQGHRIIDASQAFRQTGLNDKGQPKLAMACAHWESVWFHPRRCDTGWRGAGAFSGEQWFQYRRTRWNYLLPENTFDDARLMGNELSSPVPHIPPDVRPKAALHNYHILFEVTEWSVYPADPFLLKCIGGHLFAVIGEWELSEFEQTILSAVVV